MCACAPINRMWINQPSTLQPFHSYHGQNVLCHDTSEKFVRIHFAAGDVISMEIDRAALSPGWQQMKKTKEQVAVDLLAELVRQWQFVDGTGACDLLDEIADGARTHGIVTASQMAQWERDQDEDEDEGDE